MVRKMQTRPLHHITTSSLCSRYSLGVLALDALRSLVLVHGLGGGTRLGEKGPVLAGQSGGLLLSEEAVATIKLTELADPGALAADPGLRASPHPLARPGLPLEIQPQHHRGARGGWKPRRRQRKGLTSNGSSPVSISRRRCHDSRLDSKTKDLVCVQALRQV